MKENDCWYSVKLVENCGIATIMVRKMRKDCQFSDSRYRLRLFGPDDFFSNVAWITMCDFIRRCGCLIGCNYILLKAYQIEKFLKDNCEVKL